MLLRAVHAARVAELQVAGDGAGLGVRVQHGRGRVELGRDDDGDLSSLRDTQMTFGADFVFTSAAREQAYRDQRER